MTAPYRVRRDEQWTLRSMRLPLCCAIVLVVGVAYSQVPGPNVPPSPGEDPTEAVDLNGDGEIDEWEKAVQRPHGRSPRHPHHLNGKNNPERRPLDLPSGGRRRLSDEDEEAQEVILFFGMEAEGDSFCFFLSFLTTYWDNSEVIVGEAVDAVASTPSR